MDSVRLKMTFEKILNIFLFRTFGFTMYIAHITDHCEDTPMRYNSWTNTLFTKPKILIKKLLCLKDWGKKMMSLLTYTPKTTKTAKAYVAQAVCVVECVKG